MKLRRAWLLFAGLLPSCSLIAEFRDVPDACTGSACDASSDGGTPDSPGDAGPSDVREACPDAVNICKGAVEGWYCGYNAGLKGRACSPDDLVHCLDGAAWIVWCDAGCVGFPAGVPDMCNTCGTRQGYYCSGQLGSAAKDYFVYCSGGAMFPQKQCTNCVPGPGDAACL